MSNDDQLKDLLLGSAPPQDSIPRIVSGEAERCDSMLGLWL